MTKQKKQNRKRKVDLINTNTIKYSNNYNKGRLRVNNMPNVSLVLER